MGRWSQTAHRLGSRPRRPPRYGTRDPRNAHSRRTALVESAGVPRPSLNARPAPDLGAAEHANRRREAFLLSENANPLTRDPETPRHIGGDHELDSFVE